MAHLSVQQSAKRCVVDDVTDFVQKTWDVASFPTSHAGSFNVLTQISIYSLRKLISKTLINGGFCFYREGGLLKKGGLRNNSFVLTLKHVEHFLVETPPKSTNFYIYLYMPR